ncbi:MAG: hypothetical protein K0S91_3326 [Nitrososphaeraceae archaeon]|nr:hypothetical protein [Nitrososphaeraceae archaeon]
MSIEEIIKLTLPVNSNRDHIQGPSTAPITLLEYGDYQLNLQQLRISFGICTIIYMNTNKHLMTII